MEIIEKIERWGELQPGVRSLMRMAGVGSALRLFVVVDDLLEFIHRTDWLGYFGSVTKLHCQEMSNGLYSISALYSHGVRAIFFFYEHSDPTQPLSGAVVKEYLFIDNQVLVDKQGQWDAILKEFQEKA